MLDTQVKIVKANSSGGLERRINDALTELQLNEVVDIKITGSFDGKSDNYLAVIIYR
jgi:hypothetical protein